MKQRILVLLAIICIALFMVGCSGPPNPDASSKKLFELFGDESDRTEPVLVGHATRIFKAQREAPDDYLIRVYAYGNSVRRIYEGPAIRNRDAFNRLVASKFGRDDKEVETHTEKPMAIAAANCRGKESYALYVSTDGGQEDTSRAVMKSIKLSVATLRANPAVKQVAFVGVDPKHQLQWERWTKSLDGIRYVRGSDDAFSIPSFWEVAR